MTTSEGWFDFGDGSEKGEVISGIPTECDHTSHSLSTVADPSKADGRPILVVNISQRESLVPEAPMSLTNVSSAANSVRIRAELEAHLEAAPCMIVFYGAYAMEFESMIVLARSISSKGKGKVPIAICAPHVTGSDVIRSDAIASTIIRGVSVFYYVATLADFTTLSQQLAVCANSARESKKDISPIRFILILDKALTLLLATAIRDEGDDRLFLFDEKQERKEEEKLRRQAGEEERAKIASIERNRDVRRELSTKYFPQVETTQSLTPSMVCKEWEACTTGHMFRNAHFPPTALSEIKPPLDILSGFVAFHPFGRSFVLANVLLPKKGELVKKLLETWISTILGTPSRFIRAE
ncbi:MAG: hypothetical protein WC483_02235 [Candidatus Paceibacterota bacterium]